MQYATGLDSVGFGLGKIWLSTGPRKLEEEAYELEQQVSEQTLAFVTPHGAPV